MIFSMIEIKRYKPVHPILKNLINCFWINSGDLPALKHKLLPIRNIDLIINLSSQPLSLYDGNSEISLESCYFTGIMDHFKYSWERPAGSIELIGVSFFPAGFYPFLGIPLSEFKNSIIDLNLLDRALSERLVERVKEHKTSFEKLYALERELLKLLNVNLIIDEKMNSLISNFIKHEESTTESFCNIQGIHKRKFERFANEILGINPKAYIRLNRFRKSLYALLNNDYNTLTEVAYNCGYYDQMHFIKEFKLFTGSSPTQFLVEKKSLRQICFFS
jgi:AraC-like DNA-binding protein